MHNLKLGRARFWLAVAVGACGVACAPSAAPPRFPGDPAVTDPGKYRVLVENADVRVLRYRDRPGEKTHPHHHPCFVLYALAPFERRLTFADGSQKTRRFRAGEA